MNKKTAVEVTDNNMVIFDTLLVTNAAKARKSPTVMNSQDIKIVRVHVMM